MNSDATQGAALLWRVAGEHRRAVYTLIAGLVVNLLVFALFVYPLRKNVANVEQRTRAAEQALAAAKAEHASATGTSSGKDRAAKALQTFYTSVLPSNLAGARRLTYARLAELAAKAGLDAEHRTYEPVVERGSSLTRLKVKMDLTGSYVDVRNFIHEIETAPEFVVIDSPSLSEAADEDALRLTLELSTYFRSTEP